MKLSRLMEVMDPEMMVMAEKEGALQTGQKPEVVDIILRLFELKLVTSSSSNFLLRIV